MNNKSIYNKIPEGYVPTPKVDKSREISLLRQGSITEITLDGSTFQVSDPVRIEKIIKLVERHDERLYNMNQELLQYKRACAQLEQKVNKLSITVNKLQEQIKNAGLDRF
ncbi:hypothetical protein [Escherichia phage vB_EcoM_JNE01]|nr:hypothetical protein [Escherichia phage vB_EcoM_JNE01]